MRHSLAVLGVFACVGAPVAASVVQTARETHTTIRFTDRTFADARAGYVNEIQHIADGPDDVIDTAWTILGRFENLQVYADDWMSLDYTPPAQDPDFAAQTFMYRAGFSPGAPLLGTVYLSYDTPTSSKSLLYQQSFLSTRALSFTGVPRWTLDFRGGGTGGVDNSGVFRTFVTVPGFWNLDSTDEGGAFVSWNTSAYDTVSAWHYNAAANTTTLALRTQHYRGIDPDIRITLIGAPAPAPGAAVLALLSGVLAGTRRRRAPAR